MVKVHRLVFDRLPPPSPASPAVVLDTPYGFQENADDISARTVEYFAKSVGRRVEVAGLSRLEPAAEGPRKPLDPLGREAGLARVASAGWLFAGPGSPTYALRQWSDSEVPSLISDKLTHGGAVVFASAAALTLGRWTVPVYEIYKSGGEVVWADGQDLIRFLGDVAVIPHYNNAEGGHHDTRYCYLGETRLRALESQLPPNGWVLGVDEHTALLFDLDASTASVIGRGVVTVRRQGRSVVLPAGETMPIAALVGLDVGKGAPAAAHPAGASADAASTSGDATALHSEVRRAEAAFEQSLVDADVDAATRVALELEETLAAWARDTTQSDATDRGRAALRRMVVRLGQLGLLGARDPRSLVAPYVEALLAERDAARTAKRFDEADRVRDRLAAAGVEVRDTPAGTEWTVQDR